MEPKPDSQGIGAEGPEITHLKLQILDSAIDYAILSLTLDGVITTWNEGARRIFGWSEEAVRGQLGAIIFTSEDRARGSPEHEIRGALKTGRAIDERWHVRSDGTRFWASGEMLPLTDAQGKHTGLVKIVRDRTEKWLDQQRQHAMLHLTDQLTSLSEWPRMAEVATQSVGVGLNLAAAVYIAFDQNVPRAEGAWHHSLGNVKLATPPFFELDEALQQGRAVSVAHAGSRGVPVYGDMVAHAYALVPLIEQHQLAAVLALYSSAPREWTYKELEFAGFVASRTRAAVERRKAELALSELAAGLEHEVNRRVAERNRLWASTSDLMASLDEELLFLDVNPAWCTVLGRPPDSLLGRSFLALLREEDQHSVENAVSRVSSQERHETVVCRLRAQDGTGRVVSCSLSFEGGRFYLVARDITAQVDAEERLRQSQKMDALGQLTGGIAHDFNNLLMGITGSLDLIQTRLNGGRQDDIERYLRAARTAAHRAAALTHRLLVFARQQPLDPKPVEVNDLVAGMEELLRRTLHEGIRLSIMLNASRRAASTDAHQLENAILNLVINARDAMGEGGELRIATEDCNHLRNDRLKAGDYVCVSVSDTGGGMSPEVLAKVFEPFFTTKPLGKGTGLGLSMIYGFTRQSNGDVSIESQIGHGTTVRLYLPLAGREAAAASDQPAEARPVSSKGENILIVEDDPSVRYLLGEVLNEWGYRTVEVPDGKAALSIVRSDLHIDLLISDVGLAFVSGRQLAEVAREQRPSLKVLFITGYGRNALPEAPQDGQHTWILDKPVGLESLARKLRDILDPESP